MWWKIEVYQSIRQDVHPAIVNRNIKLGTEVLGDMWNYSAKVAYAVTWDIMDDPKLRKVLWIGDELIWWKTNEVYIGPRQGTTSQDSTKLAGILDMVWIKWEWKVEPIVYHTYDTNVENPQDKLNDSWYDKMTEMAVAEYWDVAQMFEVWEKWKLEVIDIISKWEDFLAQYSIDNGLAMWAEFVSYLLKLFWANYQRNPTDAELFAFAYANSEHCNHGVFWSHHIIDWVKQEKSLFDHIKATHARHPWTTKVAYDDDAAIFKGKKGTFAFTNKDGSVEFIFDYIDNTLKVESHNHPTRINAHEWLATWHWGVQRDLTAPWRWGTPNAAMSTFLVSDLERSFERSPYGKESALDIMAEWAIGGSNYLNEFWVPAISWNFWVIDLKVWWKHIWYDKPTGLVWWKWNIFPKNVTPKEVPAGALIIYVWGSNYWIWMWWGAASSKTSDAEWSKLDFDSVQRWNPLMQAKAKKMIDYQTSKREDNPILRKWDVGASWWTNTAQELLHDIWKWGDIDFRKVPVWDKSLWPKEVLSNESQERYICFILPEDLPEFEETARRYNTPIYPIGIVTESTEYHVHNPETWEDIIKMDINDMLGHSVETILEDNTVNVDWGELDFTKMKLQDSARKIISHPTVWNKDFLVTIWDRSVGWIVVQDQMVWWWQTPLSNVWVTLHWLEPKIWEEWVEWEILTQANRAALAIVNPEASCRMAITTAILKAHSAYIPDINTISGSWNWMLAKNEPGQLAALHKWVKALEDITDVYWINIPVWKDSMSMKEGDVMSPLTLITTLYADTTDVEKTITPDFKKVQDSEIFLIDFGEWQNRIGGSLLAQVNDQFWNDVPDVDKPEDIVIFQKAIAELQEKELLLAYHKRSDGGLFSAISEMSFASHLGVDIDITPLIKEDTDENRLRGLFTEEQWIIFQFEDWKRNEILEILKKYKLDHLWHTIGRLNFDEQRIWFSSNWNKIIDERRVDLQKAWSETSLKVKTHRKNNNPQTTKAEFERIDNESEEPMKDILTFNLEDHPAKSIIEDYEKNNKPKPKVAILSTEWTNSEKEMMRYYKRAWFDVYDVTLTDLISWKHRLSDFPAIALAGGFSHWDILGAGVWFAQTILNRPDLREQFENYVWLMFWSCNGYQELMQLSEILEWGEDFPKLTHNKSNSFEARKVQVQITEKKDAVFFTGMWGSIISQVNSHWEWLQVWWNIDSGVNYVDHDWNKTETYPLNPNGSKNWATWFELKGKNQIICWMMWHPERDYKEDSPWSYMANNQRMYLENEKTAWRISF